MEVQPDWEKIAANIGSDLSEDQTHAAWKEACLSWLGSIKSQYSGHYSILETEHFYLLSCEKKRYVDIFSAYLERTLKRIYNRLDGIVFGQGIGKFVVIIFADQDQYYDYIGRFYPEAGAFGLSSGMYINQGYGHLVFPVQDISNLEPITVHELTHACLAELLLPTWLDEGVAVVMEELLADRRLHLDGEMVTRHVNYWNADTIQQFWSGDSFYFADDGQLLSYDLAHILVRNMSADFEAFKRFCTLASCDDAGEAACIECFRSSLGQKVGAFLGPGDWFPKKDQWLVGSGQTKAVLEKSGPTI